MKPKLIIHGGAGRALRNPSRKPAIRAALHRIAAGVYERLAAGERASDAVVEACRQLEDDELFNAGTGAVMQVDGRVRLSASLMDGANQSFSGIVNGQRIRNPIELAAYLQAQDDRVLAADGVDELCRELGIPSWDNVTTKRLEEWIADRKRKFPRDVASVAAESEDARSGTVGAVALDASGRIAAATSTGGRGFERIGRVSDSATPAGNYANSHAGVSATGVGEHILDESLASKIVVRVTDGMTLEDAVRRSIEEGVTRHRNFGVIAISTDGAVVWGKSSEILLAATVAGDAILDTLDAPLEPDVGRGDYSSTAST